MKIERKSYIDELVKAAKGNSGPGALTPKVTFLYLPIKRNFYEKRVTGLSWKKCEKVDWKIKKEEGPDMGSYNAGESRKVIERSVGNTLFSKVRFDQS